MSYVVVSDAEPDLVQQCWLQGRKLQTGFHLLYEVPYTTALIHSVHTCKHSTITF